MDESSTSWDLGLAAAARQAIDAGDPHGALALYENVIKRGAADPITLANYGVLLWRHFEFRQGDAAFTRVLEDPQADTPTLRRVAHCYFEIGRFGKAADVMRLAVARMAKPDAVTTNTLAWTLERDHQSEEAREYADAAYAIDKSYGPAVRLLAHLDRRSDDLERAERRLTEQLRRYPSEFDWGLLYELATVCDRLGRYDAAWNTLCQAKSQLASQAADHVRDSYVIRRRQWELAQSVTSADLRRWRGRQRVGTAQANRISVWLSPLWHDIARTDYRFACGRDRYRRDGDPAQPIR